MTQTSVSGPTAFEAWGLAAAWVGSGAAVLGVGVAVIFGMLTLATSRRSKAAQETATVAAARESSYDDGRGVLPMAPNPVLWRVDRATGGERWQIINDGEADAFEVTVAGLTSIDQQRLAGSEPTAVVVPAAGALPFTFVSRLTLSGPGNVVVSWRSRPQAIEQSKVLRIPAE